MKKTLAILMVVALVATAAFAEVNFGAWGRGFFTPIAGNGGDDMLSSNSTSWGDQPRVGFSVSGSSDNVGFNLDIKGDGGSLAVNDNALIWVKLADMFQIKIGQAFDDTLRGNGCFGAWDWLRPGIVTGEDLTFTRVSGNSLAGAWAPLQGAIISLFPIDGLYVTAGLPTANYATVKLEDMFKNGQYAIGYTVPDLLQIKAQWIGAGDDGLFNVAVNVKAIENLALEIGAFIPTWDDPDMTFALFTAYSGIEKVGLNLSGKFILPGADGADNTINIGFAATYDLGDGMGVVGDVRVQYVDEATIAFLAGFEKGFSNGKIGIGFQGATNGCGLTTVAASEADSFQFAVPVKVEYWF